MASNQQAIYADKTKEIKICSINICGLSGKSKFMLEKYVEQNDIDILAIQETKTADSDILNMKNMHMVKDMNRAINIGCAIYTKYYMKIVPLDDIAALSTKLDTAWCQVICGDQHYIIGAIYVKLKYQDGIPDALAMLERANQHAQLVKAKGVIMVEDFNARHVMWEDHVNNSYGLNLINNLDFSKYTICSPGTPTFLSANGSSNIDLFVLSKGMKNCCTTSWTDEAAALGTGAPMKGHVPIFIKVNLKCSITKVKVTEKTDLSSIPWEDWTSAIELISENCLCSGNAQNLCGYNSTKLCKQQLTI